MLEYFWENTAQIFSETQLADTHQIPVLFLPNFKSLLKIKLTVGWKWGFWQWTATYLVCPCTSVLPGHCCSGKHRQRTANESQQCKWYTVFTLIGNLYGTHQTRFTQLVISAVKIPRLLTLSGLYFHCLCMFYRGIRPLQRQEEKEEGDHSRRPCAPRLSWGTGICQWRPV